MSAAEPVEEEISETIDPHQYAEEAETRTRPVRRKVKPHSMTSGEFVLSQQLGDQG